MAGKNRANTLSAILGNMEDLEGAYESALSAEGSAMRENEAYLDSIQGRIDIFNNSVQTMWMNFVNSEAVKTIVDIGTQLIKWVDTLGVFKTALVGIIGYFTLFKKSNWLSSFDKLRGGGLRGVFKGIGQGIGSFFGKNKKVTLLEGAALDKEIDAFNDALAKGPQAFNAYKSSAQSTKNGMAQFADAVEKGTVQLENGKVSSQQYTMALQNQTKAAQAAASKQKMVNTVIAVTSAIVSVARLAFDHFYKSAEEKLQEVEERYNNMKSTMSTLEGDVDSIDAKIEAKQERIDSLSNKKLTVEEANELRVLKAESAELKKQKEIREHMLDSYKVQDEAATLSMFNEVLKTTAANQQKNTEEGKELGGVLGGIVDVLAIAGGAALTIFSSGVGAVAGAGLIGAGVSGLFGSTGEYIGEAVGNASTQVGADLEKWYESYTTAIEKANAEAAKAEKEYLDNVTDDNYDKWQKKLEAANALQQEFYTNFDKLRGYVDSLDYNSRTKSTIDGFNDLMADIALEGVGDSTNSKVAHIRSLEEEFNKLSKGVDENGKNIALTADEYARYQSIVSQIVSFTPQLIRGYNDEGDAIVRKNGLIEDSIKLLQEQNKLAAQSRYFTSPEDFKSSFTTAKNQYDKVVNDKPQLPFTDPGSYDEYDGNYYDSATNAMAGILNKYVDPDKKHFKHYKLGGQYDDVILDHIDEAVSLFEVLAKPHSEKTQFTGYKWFMSLDQASDKFKNYLTTRVYNERSAQMAMDSFKTNELFQIPMASDYYYDLSGSALSFINAWIDSIPNLWEKDENSILNVGQDILNLTDAIGQSPQAQDLIDSLFEVDTSLPAKTFADAISGILDQIIDMGLIDASYKDDLLLYFVPDYENIQPMIDAVKDKVIDEHEGLVDTLSFGELKIAYKFVADKDPNSVTGEDILEAITAETPKNPTVTLPYTKLVNDVQAYNDVMAQTSEILVNNTKVTQEYKDSLIDLGISEEELNKYFDDTDKLLVTDAEGLKNLVKNTKNTTAENIKLAKSQAKLEYYELYKQMRDLKDETGNFTDATRSQAQALYDQMSAIDKTISKFSLLEAQLLGTANAYAKIGEAQEIDAANDYGSKAEELMNIAVNAFNTGELGTEAAQVAIEGIVPKTVYEGAATNDEKMQKIYEYLTTGEVSKLFTIEFDEEGSIKSVEMSLENVEAFTQDLFDKGIFHGSWDEFTLDPNIKTLKQFAEACGLSEEAAFAFLTSLEKYDISWIGGDNSTLIDSLMGDDFDYRIHKNTQKMAELENQLASGAIKVEEYNQAMYGLDGQLKRGDITQDEYNTSVAELKKQLDGGLITLQQYEEAVKGLGGIDNDLGASARSNVSEWSQTAEEIEKCEKDLKGYQKTLDNATLGEDGVWRDEFNEPIDMEALRQNIKNAEDELSRLRGTLNKLEKPTELMLQFARDDIQEEIDELYAHLENEFGKGFNLDDYIEMNADGEYVVKAGFDNASLQTMADLKNQEKRIDDLLADGLPSVETYLENIDSTLKTINEKLPEQTTSGNTTSGDTTSGSGAGGVTTGEAYIPSENIVGGDDIQEDIDFLYAYMKKMYGKGFDPNDYIEMDSNGQYIVVKDYFDMGALQAIVGLKNQAQTIDDVGGNVTVTADSVEVDGQNTSTTAGDGTPSTTDVGGDSSVPIDFGEGTPLEDRIGIYQQRLAELENQLASGAIEVEDYNKAMYGLVGQLKRGEITQYEYSKSYVELTKKLENGEISDVQHKSALYGLDYVGKYLRGRARRKVSDWSMGESEKPTELILQFARDKIEENIAEEYEWLQQHYGREFEMDANGDYIIDPEMGMEADWQIISLQRIRKIIDDSYNTTSGDTTSGNTTSGDTTSGNTTKSSYWSTQQTPDGTEYKVRYDANGQPMYAYQKGDLNKIVGDELATLMNDINATYIPGVSNVFMRPDGTILDLRSDEEKEAQVAAEAAAKAAFDSLHSPPLDTPRDDYELPPIVVPYWTGPGATDSGAGGVTTGEAHTPPETIVGGNVTVTADSVEVDGKKPQGQVRSDIIADLGLDGLNLDKALYDHPRVDGYTIVDATIFSQVLEQAGYTEQQIDSLLNKIREYNNVIAYKSNPDPLGLNQVTANADTVIDALEQLGIATNITFDGEVSFNVQDLVAVLQSQGWTPAAIQAYCQQLQNNASVAFQITGMDQLDALLQQTQTVPEEEQTEYDVSGNGEKDLDDISETWAKVPTNKSTTYTIYQNVVETTQRRGGLLGLLGWSAADGTAHADGTAYKGGSWGAPNTEEALVGELGPEMRVRGNKWELIGQNGAEFTDIRKGDIIFNHKQTEDLLSKGHLSGRGKAYAHGTSGAAYGYVRESGATGTPSSTAAQNKANKTTTTTVNGFAGAVNTFADAVHKAADDYSNKTGDKKDKGDGKNKKNEDESKEIFDWIEVKLEEINEDINLNGAKLENAIGSTKQNAIIDQMIGLNRDLYDNLIKGADEYYRYAKTLLADVPEAYRDAAQDGKIAIEEFVGEVDAETLAAIQNYREWVQKGADATQQAEEVLTEIQNLAKQAIDNIAQDYENQTSIPGIKLEQLEAYNSLLETTLGYESENIYKALMKANNKQIALLKQQREKMQAELNAQVEAGNIKKYSQNWYDAISDIAAVDTEIIELTTDTKDYQDAINELHWDRFDNLMSRLEAISDEAENLVDILSNKDLVDKDTAEWTDEGITSLGLYAQQMEVAEVQAKKYKKEIQDLNRDWKKLGYTEQEYVEKLEELKNGQYDAIKAYNDTKDAIKDLTSERVDAIKEGIEKEIEAYEELISKKKEELDAEKDLYDFQKGIASQQKEIADIERKLAALSSDNSASARAQRAQLQAELLEKRQELEDTYYDRSVSDQQEALDKELEAFREEKDKEIEGWEEYLENTEKVVADGLATIQANTDTVYNTLQDMGKEYSLFIADALTSPWKYGEDAIQSYSEKFKLSTSETVEELQKITEEHKKLIEELEGSGSKYSNQTTQNVDAYQQATYKEPVKENNTQTQDPSQQQNVVLPTKGSSVTVKAGTTHWGSKSGNASMGSFVPGRTYTVSNVYGTGSNAQVLLSKKDMNKKSKTYGKTVYMGWIDLKNLEGYASGTTGVKNDQLAWIDELGEELVLHAGPNGKLNYLTKGSGVISADLTENLMGWGELDPSIMLERSKPVISAPHITNNEMVINIEYGDILHIDEFNGDKPEELSKMIDKAFNKHMKDLNQQIRRYVR